MDLNSLSPVELRILGTLSEKQRTVPDTYPLSMNALLAGCNQKTSRQPVMEVTESEALIAIDHLKELGFVEEIFGNRVTRFAHRLEKSLEIGSAAAALMTVLILRGPLTAGELRLNTERMHNFADISSVEAYLEELAEAATPLTTKLPRQPGARECRWAHLLGDVVPTQEYTASSISRPTNAEIAALTERVTQLEVEMTQMRQLLNSLTQ